MATIRHGTERQRPSVDGVVLAAHFREEREHVPLAIDGERHPLTENVLQDERAHRVREENAHAFGGHHSQPLSARSSSMTSWAS